ncbi:MAG: FliA/WhiG family RNA polymerase sigma factor [Anaerolineae bacterium]|nr:FliA/WhiG family RNA polymerase sigma factor [Anaerolineae bacterium]
MPGSSRNGSGNSANRGGGASEVERLWEEYARTRSSEIRERLVVHYAWLVKHVLGRLAVVLPPSLDYGDLVGHGTVALLEAVDRFEPERGNKFETYASVKVRGAILDAIRSMDLVSRPVRRRMRMVSEAVTRLTREHGRAPSDEEVAASLGMTVPQLLNVYRRGAAAVISLDSLPAVDPADDDMALHEALADEAQVDPAEEAVRGELSDTVAAAIESLPHRDQTVLSLYYHNGLNMREIGETLGISESRVCQIHGKAITYLRAWLSRRDPELAQQAAATASRMLVGA